MSTDVMLLIKENALKFHPSIAQYITFDDFEALIKGVIKRESNWKADDVMEEHNVNDFSIGYMQVRIETAKWMLGMWNKADEDMKKDLFEPSLNLYVGIKYLAYLLNRYKGNKTLSVGAYNSGTAKVKDGINYGYTDHGYVKTDAEIEMFNADPKPLINQSYVNDILRYADGYGLEKKTHPLQ